MDDNRNGTINFFQISRSVAGVLQVRYLSPRMIVHMGQVIMGAKKSYQSDLKSILMSSSRANASITRIDASNSDSSFESTIIESSSRCPLLTYLGSVISYVSRPIFLLKCFVVFLWRGMIFEMKRLVDGENWNLKVKFRMKRAICCTK